MNMEVILFLLLLVSTLTGLVTEAIKNSAAERGKSIRPNTTAGVVSFALSAFVGIGYVLYTGQIITLQVVLCIVALVFLSWLCAMVGYDKVIQTLVQIKASKFWH